ncbi:MAG: ribbon-helix-helix protein, CopG family [Clostridia bacterium]|nr:ribbon-helix-helix protein, CopG family [Clostridia bacterium]
MSVSIRLNDSELAAIKTYAASYGMTVSECIRRAILEQIEDEYDLQVFEEAYAEYKKNPVTYTHEEVKKELGLE